MSKMTIESLFCPPTVGGMALAQCSAPIVPSSGANYTAGGVATIATQAGQQYWILSGANEVGATFNNGTQAQPFNSAGQSFVFTAQGATVTITGAAANAIYTATIQTVAIQATVPALTTRSTGSCRMRVFSKPQNPICIKVLGKMAYVPMTFAYHEPQVKASSQACMAFALAAMLKRARQYGKAGAEEQKAAALLLECAKLHSIQRTNNQRFVPSDGYGNDYWSPSQCGAWGALGR